MTNKETPKKKASTANAVKPKKMATSIPEGSATSSQYIAPDYSEFLKGNTKLWNEILPGLWQGGTDDLDLLGDYIAGGRIEPFITKKEFDAVVTMYQYANPVDWLVKEYRFCIYDSNIEHFDLEDLFNTAKWAHNEWKNGKRVLIRCQAGLNRSGLVMALVLIREGYKPEHAIQLIRSRRNSQALFNNQFVKFLMNIDPKAWTGDTYGV